MIEIGNALKEARTKKALTLEDVYSKIKIHPNMLQCLEDGRFKDLPSPFFVKHFLKTYADFLELRADDLIRLYEGGPAQPQEVAKPKETVLPNKPHQTMIPKTKKTFKLPLKFIKIAGIVIIVLVAVYLIVPAALGLIKVAYTNIQKNKPKQTQIALLKKPQIKKTPITTSNSNRVVSTQDQKINSEWLRSSEQGNFPVLRKGSELELKITALEPVWVKVTCDGKVLFQSTIRRENTETWKAKDSIEIKTGNPSNMKLMLNQYELGSPRKGAVRKFLITHKGIKIIS